jgi:regulator of replication initiation timing
MTLGIGIFMTKGNQFLVGILLTFSVEVILAAQDYLEQFSEARRGHAELISDVLQFSLHLLIGKRAGIQIIMDSSRQHVNRMTTRLAFMNAENDRLKKVIQDYERRIFETQTSRRSQVDLDDCSEDSQLASLGIFKQPSTDKGSNRWLQQQPRGVIDQLKRQLDKVNEENNWLSQENSHIKRQLSFGPDKENRSSDCNEPTPKDYIFAIKHLKGELEELHATIRQLRDENRKLFTEEEIFEKLKEQEIMLLGTLKLSEKSEKDESFSRKRFDAPNLGQSTTKMANQQGSPIDNFFSSGKVPLTWRQEFPQSEESTHGQMYRLELKVDELINENDSLLRENQELKDLSLSILNSTKRSTTNCTCGSQQQSNSQNHPDSKKSAQDETFSSRDKELVDFVQIVESKFNKDKQAMEDRVKELEAQVSRLKQVRSQSPSPLNSSVVKITDSKELEEAYLIVERLEKENTLLLTRIDHLENASSRNKDETDKLYTIIEQKNKSNSDLIRERSLELARNSYRTQDSPS